MSALKQTFNISLKELFMSFWLRAALCQKTYSQVSVALWKLSIPTMGMYGSGFVLCRAPISMNLFGAKPVFISSATWCQEITDGFCYISLPGFSIYKIFTYLFQAWLGSKIQSILCQFCQNQTGNSLWAQKIKQYCSVSNEDLG